jgi:hypothetical protein
MSTVVAIATVAALAEATLGFSQVTSPSSSFTPSAGQYVITPHSSEPVRSLDDLVKMSQIILDGSVVEVLPPINRNPDMLGEVETDAVISINSVLHGKAPTRGQLLLIEEGGKQGKWSITVKGNPGVQPGERYILFLHLDERQSIANAGTIIPDAVSTSRYYGLDYANGKAKVDADGSMQFAAGATDLSAQYNGQNLTAFTETLKSRIAALFPTPPPYPFGTTPLTPPPNTLFPKPGTGN